MGQLRAVGRVLARLRLPERPATETGVAALVGAAALWVYWRTLCPTVYVGDSGELITAAATLGIPHPTGYPLYVLLGKLLLLLVPAGTLAWRMNLFSAVCAAAAAAGLVLTLRAQGLRRPAAVGGGLVLAFSFSLWSQATCARVYALQALFAVVCLHFTLAFVRTRAPRALWAFALVAGFAAANHTVVIAQLAVMALVIAVLCPRLFTRAGVLAKSVLLLLPGLSLYLYLPLRSRMDPALDWGNPETPALFWRFITRAEFWQRSYVTGWADLPEVLGRYLRLIPEEFSWPGAVVLAIGIAVLVRRRDPVLLVCLATYLVNVALLALHGGWADIFQWPRYVITGLIALAVVVGCAFDAAAGWLAATLRPRLSVPVTALVVLALPAFLLLRSYPAQDKSGHTLALDYGLAVLESVPEGGVLLAYGDNVAFPLRYLVQAEGRRPDVRLVMPDSEGLPAAEELDPDRYPICSTVKQGLALPTRSVSSVAEGMVFRMLSSSGERQARPPEDRIPLRGFDSPSVPKDFMSRSLVGEFFFHRGTVYADLGAWDQARTSFRTAVRLAADVPLVLHLVGQAYQHYGWIDEAIAIYERVLRLNPNAEEGRILLHRLRAVQGAEKLKHSPFLQAKVDLLLRQASERLQAGDVDGAQEVLVRSIEIAPGSIWAHRRLGRLLLDSGRPAAALEHFEIASLLQPADPTDYALIARARQQLESAE